MIFSIIVPVYNLKDWIHTCVQSLLRQTFSDYEVILVDDGSTDGSGQICEEIAELYPHFSVIHKENGGAADARNYGIERAKGDYLLFIDGDDYIADWTLEVLYNEIKEKGVDAILSEGMYVDKEGKIDLVAYFQKDMIQGISGEQALLITTKIKQNWSPCGKCYSTHLWKVNGFQFQKGNTVEDFQLIDRVILCAEKVSMVSTFYYYQQRQGSQMHSKDAKIAADILESVIDWKGFLESADIDTNLKKQMYSLHASELYHGVLAYIYLFEDEKEKERLLKRVVYAIDCLKYNYSIECILIRICLKLLGVRITCMLLGTIKKRRISKM